MPTTSKNRRKFIKNTGIFSIAIPMLPMLLNAKKKKPPKKWWSKWAWGVFLSEYIIERILDWLSKSDDEDGNNVELDQKKCTVCGICLDSFDGSSEGVTDAMLICPCDALVPE